MNEEQLLASYREIIPTLADWGCTVDNMIMQILEPFERDRRLKIAPKFRPKNEVSFISKALYKKRAKPYTNPLLDIEDKVGTRIVMLTSSDIDEVATLLMAHEGWRIKKDRDPNIEMHNAPYMFDYQSIHLIVRPLENSSKFPENVVNLLACEVQIRTLLQHAYAEVSHDSTYKGPYRNDREIQRKMAKSMALMEATDDYFCDIFKLMTDEKRKYRLYLDELSSRFLSVKPSFKKEQVDITVSDLVFELLAQKDISLQDLDRFLAQNESELTPYIQRNRSFLFSQPVILLIAYFLYNHRNFLKSNWPLNYDALVNVMNGFGYSTETN